MIRPALLLLALTSGTLAAQQTFLVDGFGEFGVQTIDAALAQAAPGDTILVIARDDVLYEGSILSTGVTIRGLGRPLVRFLELNDLPAGQQFVAADLELSLLFDATNCAGPVHLENVATGTLGSFLIDCTQVTLHRCDIQALNIGYALTATRSEVALSSCRIVGADQLPTTIVQTGGLAAEDSTVYLSDCEVLAGRGTTDLNPALLSTDSTTFIRGSRIEGGPGDLRGSGAVFVDLRSRADCTEFVLDGGTCTQRQAPLLEIPDPRLGGDLLVDVVGNPDDVAVVYASLPTASASVLPGLAPVWVNLGAPFLLGAGVLDPGGRLSLTVPTGSIVAGSVFALQAATVTGGMLDLTLPTTVVVR